MNYIHVTNGIGVGIRYIYCVRYRFQDNQLCAVRKIFPNNRSPRVCPSQAGLLPGEVTFFSTAESAVYPVMKKLRRYVVIALRERAIREPVCSWCVLIVPCGAEGAPRYTYDGGE